MRIAVVFTSCLFIILGVYSTREDGFTSDIDWNKLTETWFLTVSTKIQYWSTLFKCHIFVPYNVTDKGMQIYYYNVPVNSGSDASGVIQDFIFGPGGEYTAVKQENTQWISLEDSVVFNQKLDIKEQVVVDELSWFNSHPIYFSTYCEVIISHLKFHQGRVGIRIYTRNQRVSAVEAVELRNLARTYSANEDLELKGCGDITPRQYLK